MKKTGFIAIVGRPNVGKSTLLNALLGEKIAIVSKKPQTTRNQIHGILTKDETQYVFVDTPGMLRKSFNRLGDYMVKSVNTAIGGVDAAYLVCDVTKKVSDTERSIADKLKKRKIPVILVINKTDLSNAAELAEAICEYSALADFHAVVPMSAINKRGVDILLEETDKFISEGDWLFDEDMITDQPERSLAAEIIREKLLRTLDEEIPHGTAVVIEGFKETSKLITINAEIYCEKASHKGIIIGKGGETLKKVGSYAREDLENFFGVKVNLQLWVRVKENWRDSAVNLANFGFSESDL
ncbi:MAG: GTPase Era [Clostridia bacterium]|jgi:GTP-binding protein Era|nr:GTPase Era [Clostridia bacterium]